MRRLVLRLPPSTTAAHILPLSLSCCTQVGFLADKRRMNVAVTRARRQCTLVCDTETLGHDAFLKGLTQYFEGHGVYSSAAEWES